MKKVLFILSLFALSNANAQLRDTVIVNTDTVVINNDAIVIEPVIVNAKGDTAFSINWTAFNLSRDTAQGCQTYVQLFDKHGRAVADFNQPIPASVVAVWGTDPAPIDDYILAMNPRFKRYVKKPGNGNN